MNHSRNLRQFAALLALVGVLLRGAIPIGFMPAEGADARDGGWLMLCSGDGGQDLAMLLQLGHHHHHHDAATSALQADHQCPYAAAATPALPSLWSSSPLVTRAAPAFFSLATRRPPSTVRFIRPPPRGPPISL